MNLLIEIDRLPRQSRVALAGHLLRDTRPTIKEIAAATLTSKSAVAGWVTKRGGFPKANASVQTAPSGARLHQLDGKTGKQEIV